MPGHLVIKKATFSKAKIKIITGSNLSLEQIVASRKIFFDEQGKLAEVFSLLYKANKIDFTNYKQTTVKRRIIRRMGINRIERFADYIAHLKLHPTELIALAQDILIHVTNFFREPVTFHELKNKVFPNLANQRPPNSAIRIWVPGCSTGEEAYSIAITLVEYLEDQALPFQFKSSPPTSMPMELMSPGEEFIPKTLPKTFQRNAWFVFLPN